MSLNPFEEKGIPLEKQFRHWTALNSTPYDKERVHPYTRTRAILMNGIEVEAAIFSHQLARHIDDIDLKRQLALTRRIEQQQQKAVNWLIPGDESTLEVTIGFEQVAVDLTAHLASTEPDPHVKQALDFALLEDFDHLYRYANLMDLTQGKPAEEVTGPYTEITIGRPTISEHRHPHDEVRQYADGHRADILTKLHIMTIIAAEQQTMNLYMNVGNRLEDMLGRGLYLEIAEIEEQHVTHYESLLDPRQTWLERLVMHEYNECWLYYSLMQEEPDSRVKRLWEEHLAMEIQHLHEAGELLKKYENQDPEQLVPKQIPEPLSFHPNVEYVREVIEKQTDYNAYGVEIGPGDKLPSDAPYHRYQAAMNQDGAPSQSVIERRINAKGEDYRVEHVGEHPIARFRNRKQVTR